MAAIDTTRTSYGLQSFAGHVGAVIVNIINAVAEWNDARVTRNALSSLSDRELDDIGLIRGDIDSVAVARHRF